MEEVCRDADFFFILYANKSSSNNKVEISGKMNYNKM